MAIIALLISLVLPSIAGVREATRRVICASNQRQQGLGIAMYAEDWKGLPATAYEPKDGNRTVFAPQNMNVVRGDAPETEFDGLGLLFPTQYLNAPQVFYCPSHHGAHPWSKYASLWPEETGQLVINYQYRGTQMLASTQPDRRALITDGLSTRSEFSHTIGSNVLRADYSVAWLSDPGILRTLPELENDAFAADKVDEAWHLLDSPVAASGSGH